MFINIWSTKPNIIKNIWPIYYNFNKNQIAKKNLNHKNTGDEILTRFYR